MQGSNHLRKRNDSRDRTGLGDYMNLRNVASRVRRRLFQDKDRPETLFDLFFSGRHRDALDLYQTVSLDSWSVEEHHMALASMVALNIDIAPVARRIPPPLTRDELLTVLRTQIQNEESNPARGLLVQPRYLHKSLLAAAIGLGTKKRYFVETGTYTGQSLYKISALFDELFTVEASPFLYKAANQLFAVKGLENVRTFLGDSRRFLQALEPQIGGSAVFFLDAHYSTGITSKDFGACPVIEEIAIILERFPNAVIIVDDLRTMTGHHGYPTLDAVLNSLPHTRDVQIAFDQLIIGPSRIHSLITLAEEKTDP